MIRVLRGAPYLLVSILFAANLFLAGCGTSIETAQGTRTLADSLAIDSLQANADRLRAENAQLRKSNAQLDQDKKALNAKVADITSKLGQSSQQWQDLQDLQNRVNQLDSELTVQQQINRDLSAKNAGMEKQLMSGAATQGATMTNAEFKKTYDEALKHFRARKYKEASASLENLAASRVEDPLVSNAHYWLGECYYAMQKYSDAIQEFKKTLTYPKSYKEGAAYVMLGMSYIRLGDKANARASWEKLVKDYPKSQYAVRAKRYLKQL